MSLDVLKSNMLSMDDRLHRVRGYQGAIECASNIRRLTEGSEILAVKEKKVQDAQLRARDSARLKQALADLAQTHQGVAAAIEQVVTGLNAPGERAHSPNERYAVEDFYRGVRTGIHLFSRSG